MTINFDYETDKRPDTEYEEVVTQVINEAMDYEKCPYEAEVNVLLTDNEGIREINREYRKMDSPTDVLSFPMTDYEAPSQFDFLENCENDCFNPETGELILGDIVLSVDKIKEQAYNYGHAEKRELAFLVAHSMLHLFGYDHESEEEAAIMEAKQNEILNKLNIRR
ncbi:MAG: rRNA maturation RNase YbeY [Thermoflexaceae bacterium]|nr:rRNA maturation RNase YbeY [Thermoflexaceae bacterium]